MAESAAGDINQFLVSFWGLGYEDVVCGERMKGHYGRWVYIIPFAMSYDVLYARKDVSVWNFYAGH